MLQRFLASFEAEEERSVAYGFVSTSMMVFRSMTNLQQTLVLRLLFQDHIANEERHHYAALAELEHTRLLVNFGEKTLLFPAFADALRRGFSQSSNAKNSLRMAEVLAKKAQNEAASKWDSAIQFIGDPLARFGPRKHEPPSALIHTALEEGLLVSRKKKKKNTEPGDCTLTQTGFKFLLADTHDQLWTLLLGFIKMRLAKKKMTPADAAAAISFICSAAFGESFRKMETEAVSSDIPALCVSLGIVHAFGGGGWAPTTLAQRLSPSTLAEESQQGFLVLENNFRVYAYTQSLLHIRILSMFVRLEYRLPNLVVGTITRKSALRALIEYGVTSAQLLSYLRSNAHPRMRSRSPVVPDVITDQLRAWEAERRRVIAEDGVLFEQFPNRQTHELAVRVAESRGGLLWSKAWQPGMVDGFVFVRKDAVDAVVDALSKISL